MKEQLGLAPKKEEKLSKEEMAKLTQ